MALERYKRATPRAVTRRRAVSADQSDRLWRHNKPITVDGRTYPPGNAGEYRAGRTIPSIPRKKRP